MKSKGSLVLDRMLALSTDKQVAAPCGCELFRSGSDGKSVTFRYCELHAQAPALLEALVASEAYAARIHTSSPPWDDCPNGGCFWCSDCVNRVINMRRAAIEAAK